MVSFSSILDYPLSLDNCWFLCHPQITSHLFTIFIFPLPLPTVTHDHKKPDTRSKKTSHLSQQFFFLVKHRFRRARVWAIYPIICWGHRNRCTLLHLPRVPPSPIGNFIIYINKDVTPQPTCFCLLKTPISAKHGFHHTIPSYAEVTETGVLYFTYPVHRNRCTLLHLPRSQKQVYSTSPTSFI